LNAPRVFDGRHYELLNRARGDAAMKLLSAVARPMNLTTAVDIGCGIGYFSALLHSLGLHVTAVDGRRENVEEAARRYPQIPFRTANAEDAGLSGLGKFDLTFCFGLLYHLENPFIAIRNLRAMTKSILLAESVIYQSTEPAMFLVDEAAEDDQGLQHIAFYPTEACLIKMLYSAGFAYVYRLAEPPNHEDFCTGDQTRRVRTFLVASIGRIDSDLVRVVDNPKASVEPWNSKSELPKGGFKQRLKRIAREQLTNSRATRAR
jgi:SAM-dependent methyltransferase